MQLLHCSDKMIWYNLCVICRTAN
uniref:Uncharacterized protein n=1 Tax=Arundo donax TaxID=35708 RepID=A0A0A9BQP8_ARUDO